MSPPKHKPWVEAVGLSNMAEMQETAALRR
jgi:hypothetical protein